MLADCLRPSSSELERWRREAVRLCPDRILPLALDSLKNKAFHSIGGSVFAANPRVPRQMRGDLTGTIVALQTMSDYLDSLVDRAGCLSMEVHERLHSAFVECLANTDVRPRGDRYFEGFPLGGDGGYLGALIGRVAGGVSRLPGYSAVRERVIEFASLYAEMQSRKHIEPYAREPELRGWFSRRCRHDIEWWEFGAAAGSTLAIFALLSEAANPHATRAMADAVCDGYFPHACAVHILLDYLIDAEEDRLHGDLNFTSYYGSPEESVNRMRGLYEEARQRLRAIPGCWFHLLVLNGLLAMYLSDPKARRNGLAPVSRSLLDAGGMESANLRRLCTAVRALGFF